MLAFGARAHTHTGTARTAQCRQQWRVKCCNANTHTRAHTHTHTHKRTHTRTPRVCAPGTLSCVRDAERGDATTPSIVRNHAQAPPCLHMCGRRDLRRVRRCGGDTGMHLACVCTCQGWGWGAQTSTCLPAESTNTHAHHHVRWGEHGSLSVPHVSIKGMPIRVRWAHHRCI